MPARRLRLTAVSLTIALVAAVTALQGCAADVPDPPGRSGSEQAGGGGRDLAAEATTTPEVDGLRVSEYEVTGGEVAVVTTSKGVVELGFFPEDAPNTVATFLELAEDGFFDGIRFHRVIPGFVVQGGDPQTKGLEDDFVREVVGRAESGRREAGDPPLGTGGPGFDIAAEFNERPHVTGTLAMARSQHPDSAGSQFYICLAPQPSLDRQYTVFGEVVNGMDVVLELEVGDVVESVRVERR